MAYEQEKYRTGGSFGGGPAFGGRNSAGGIQLRNPGRYTQATAGMSNLQGDIQSFLNTPGRQVPPNKQGMVHSPQETGFLPKMPNPGFGYSGSAPSQERQAAVGALPPPSAPPGSPQPGAYEFGNAGGAGAFPSQGGAPESVLANKVGDGIYQDALNKNSYGDSPSTATNFTRTGSMGIPRIGGVAAPTNGGPFGRTPEEQAGIEQRVGEIQRATDFIRGMRDIPSELDRFKAQAQQRVSLNQGIGGFLNQASQRNYARDRVTELEKGSLDQAKLAQEATQQGFDNALAQRNAAKGAFKTTTIVGPDGKEMPLTTNTATGETTIGDAPQRQMSESEARSEYSRLADQAWSDQGGPFTDEQDVFKIDGKGVTRNEWVEAQIRKATGAEQQPKMEYTDEEVEATAKKYNMTPEQVKEFLSGKR